MNCLYMSAIPTITPITTLTIKYHINNSNIIKAPLNKTSVAQNKENKF